MKGNAVLLPECSISNCSGFPKFERPCALCIDSLNSPAEGPQQGIQSYFLVSSLKMTRSPGVYILFFCFLQSVNKNGIQTANASRRLRSGKVKCTIELVTAGNTPVDHPTYTL